MPYRITIALLLCCCTVFADEPTSSKTGDFTVNFSQRSPLSNLKELDTRFTQKNLGPDYDLSAEQFIVHVPAQYDPEKPPGLLVLINYKETHGPPTPVLPLLDEKNLIFIAEQTSQESWWIRCGKALDAVYNMQQLYKVDPQRTYIFSFTNEDECGMRLATCYSDVFNGSFLCQESGLWQSVPSANGRFYPAKIPHPPVKFFNMAKTHPLILQSQTQPDYNELVGKSLKSQGFRSIKTGLLDVEDYHYPNYKVPWLTDVLTFLDTNAPPVKKPTSHPTSKPSK